MLIVDISFLEDKQERYVIPVALATKDKAAEIKNEHLNAVIEGVEIDQTEAIIYDGTYDEVFRDKLFTTLVQRGKLKGKNGMMAGVPGRRSVLSVSKNQLPLASRLISADQSNTAILYDQRFFFKIYRSLEEGYNPELELLKFLTEHTKFEHFPTYAGSIEYRAAGKEPVSLGVLVKYVPNEGNAWEFTQTSIDQYFEKIVSRKEELRPLIEKVEHLDELNHDGELMHELTGHFFLEMIELMGRRTAEMHLALASNKTDKAFKPEAFSLLYQKSMYQSFRTTVKRTFSSLKSSKRKLDSEIQDLIGEVVRDEDLLLKHIKQSLEKKKITSEKIRVHGDYHLGQVLFTGKDFIIIDFEGEPIRSLTARKLKYCPFKDISGMLRSFHYAIYMGFFKHVSMLPEDRDFLAPWLEFWYEETSKKFVTSYLSTAAGASFIPDDPEQVDTLIDLFTIEKAIYETEYELNNRPDWLTIPLNGLKKLMGY
jgi:maltose alpha-D-glucosyltransferase/alpha-amylase